MSQTYSFLSPSDVALTAPPGVIPDFQNPYTLRPYWITTAALGVILTGLFLALRLYTKVIVVKETRWEDCTCSLGFTFFLAWVALNFKAVEAQGGAHQWNVTDRQLAHQNKYFNYSDMVYSPAVGFTKVSILLLVLRIFCPQARDPFYWILQALNILNTIFYTVFFFIPIFLCRPREKIWLPETPGSCMDIFGLYIASASFNTCSDVAMYVIPLWRVWHLQMSKSRKLGITAIFAMGGFAIASSIVRLVFAILLLKPDFSYIKVQAICWTVSELAFGLICSCLYVLPRLYRHLAAIPPFGSEEYELRKHKNDRSAAKQHLEASDDGDFHRQQEERNHWDRDVEGPTAAVSPFD